VYLKALRNQGFLFALFYPLRSLIL
jgi:hypothetical protein